MALIKFPNGDWLKPDDVKEITIVVGTRLEDPNSLKSCTLYTVIVDALGKRRRMMDTKDEKEAHILRDALAEQVNRALYRGEK